MAKWYNKTIYTVTGRNFISILTFLFSIVFYTIQNKLVSVYLFSLTIGDIIGDRVGHKYSNKKTGPLICLFFIILGVIIKNILGTSDFVLMVFTGIGMGIYGGIEMKKFRLNHPKNW